MCGGGGEGSKGRVCLINTETIVDSLDAAVVVTKDGSIMRSKKKKKKKKKKIG